MLLNEREIPEINEEAYDISMSVNVNVSEDIMLYYKEMMDELINKMDEDNATNTVVMVVLTWILQVKKKKLM